MFNLIKAEYIKGKRSFGKRSLVIFPLLVAMMAIALMGGAYAQAGAYNWWYMMFLPTCVALMCINLIEPEKTMCFFNVAVVPIQKDKQWLAKIWTGCCYLFISNLIVYALTSISGFLFASQYPVWQGFAAALVLTVTWAWQIPLGMLLTWKFNSMVTFMAILCANILCSIQDIAGGRLWIIPFAIPARLMSPILGINPNGITMSDDSPLHDFGVVAPGILICAILFVLLLLATKKLFANRSE